MKLSRDITSELGPTLLFDRQFLPRLRQASEDVLLAGTIAELAKEGLCAWVDLDEAGRLDAKLEVCIDEPEPAASPLARYVSNTLRLCAPSGELLLCARDDLHANDLPTFAQTKAGNYALRITSHKSPEEHFQHADLPGTPEPGDEFAIAGKLAWALLAVQGVFIAWAIWLGWRGQLLAAATRLIALPICWLLKWAYARLSGLEAKRSAIHNAFQHACANAKREPDLRMSLRLIAPGEAEPGAGGGMSY
jgi:hypothetical protein